MKEKHQHNHDHHDHHMNHDTNQSQTQNHNQHKENHHDHSSHHKIMIIDFKKRLIVTSILTIPILLLSPMIQMWFNFTLNIPYSIYILFVLSTIVFLYGGYPFLKGAIDEIKEKNIGMMTLIAMAISVAYLFSSLTVFGLEGSDFFWELATLILIMLLGHIIEMKSIINASSALSALIELMPHEAHLIDGGEIKDIHLSNLKSNDLVLIKPGEKIPADGIIKKGEGHVNESMLTGESKPLRKKVGQELIAGSINGDSSFELEVKHVGDDTYLSKIIKLVDDAQNAKSKTQNLAEKTAKALTYVALIVGFVTFAVWSFLTGDYTFALARMATVMVIACPHALGLATPLVVAHSTALSAQNGLLIKKRTPFEQSGKITTVVFDKTGTLTYGNFGVNFVQVLDDTYSKDEIIILAASIEQNSEHPIARGIVEEAEKLDQKLYKVDNFQAIKGKGVEGNVNQKKIEIVSGKEIENRNIDLPKDLPSHEISTNVFMLIDEKLIAVIGLSDQIRETSFEAIQALKSMGIETWMLTGDNEKTAKEVAQTLELDGYFSEVLPHEKQEKIKELQEKGHYVAMAGDGVNDAPALAQANVGIAIGSGTDVAAETADIVLVNSNPNDVVKLIHLGKATHKKMIENLIWATGYNVIAIPLAAGVLASIGIILSPAIGAVFMSLSTVIVAINAKLLKIKQ
ncbi:MAG: copper-translocating P-type ATPase [Tenericutes bacterium HGW-Tenericutes-2]|jgi:Cu2+-exporting ATPase|nr:MAG: copper-translocating P-type ATPase [Tenericutes bacterium HGW-Tenericutes-2]